MKNIKNILFDCDGVLYQDLESVFGQVSKRMTQYISEKLKINLVEAKKLQTDYFHTVSYTHLTLPTTPYV